MPKTTWSSEEDARVKAHEIHDVDLAAEIGATVPEIQRRRGLIYEGKV